MDANERQHLIMTGPGTGRTWRLAAGALALLVLAGCATTDDSDMPWATPATWEGSPYIPGLSE